MDTNSQFETQHPCRKLRKLGARRTLPERLRGRSQMACCALVVLVEALLVHAMVGPYQRQHDHTTCMQKHKLDSKSTLCLVLHEAQQSVRDDKNVRNDTKQLKCSLQLPGYRLNRAYYVELTQCIGDTSAAQH